MQRHDGRFPARKGHMEGFDTPRHKIQSDKRAKGAALAGFARAESIVALAKPDAFRRGARSCSLRVIPAKEQSGASRRWAHRLNPLGNSLLVRCSEMLLLLFACLTGENTRDRFVDIQADPRFFGRLALCAAQQKVPERVFDSADYRGFGRGFSRDENRVDNRADNRPDNRPDNRTHNRADNRLEHPVSPDQVFESVGDSGMRKFFISNPSPVAAQAGLSSRGTPTSIFLTRLRPATPCLRRSEASASRRQARLRRTWRSIRRSFSEAGEQGRRRASDSARDGGVKHDVPLPPASPGTSPARVRLRQGFAGPNAQSVEASAKTDRGGRGSGKGLRLLPQVRTLPGPSCGLFMLE